jgi:hypothetical protein
MHTYEAVVCEVSLLWIIDHFRHFCVVDVLKFFADGDFF